MMKLVSTAACMAAPLKSLTGLEVRHVLRARTDVLVRCLEGDVPKTDFANMAKRHGGKWYSLRNMLRWKIDTFIYSTYSDDFNLFVDVDGEPLSPWGPRPGLLDRFDIAAPMSLEAKVDAWRRMDQILTGRGVSNKVLLIPDLKGERHGGWGLWDQAIEGAFVAGSVLQPLGWVVRFIGWGVEKRGPHPVHYDWAYLTDWWNRLLIDLGYDLDQIGCCTAPDTDTPLRNMD